MNTSAKGKRAEKRCVTELEAAGYWAFQTHLSRGPFDVVAGQVFSILDDKAGGFYRADIRFIQVKARSGKQGLNVGSARKELRELAQNVPSNASCELWVWLDRATEFIKETIA